MSWLYRLTGRFPSVVIARRNITRAKARSVLAAAAILIGVVAIGSIGAGGAAFKQSQLQSIQEQGATNVFVAPGFDKPEGSFDREDLRDIEETVGPAGVVATQGASREVVGRAGRRETVSVSFIEDVRPLYAVERGSIPENWRRSAVVSAEFAAERGLSPDDRITLVRQERTGGETVEHERTYRVTAVLAQTQGFGVTGVYLPIEQAEDRRYSQVRVTTGSADEAEAAATALRERFNDRKELLLVFELTALLRLLRTIIDGINVFLAGLGSLSLLVAGVAIMNTMLMAVLKRREEIGVLRAVGYTKRDVVRILLVEAAMLGLIGAVLGLGLSLLVVLAANAVFLGDPLAFTAESVGYLVAALGFGIATSLVAGAYPAWRAARERPVEALRG